MLDLSRSTHRPIIFTNSTLISTSEIKISVLIDEDEAELAVRVLHSAYELDAVD